MPPTVLLIRHAQALHNVSSNWALPDPPLSPLGIQQCHELQESLQASTIGHGVELIIVSAMRRTLQTASLGLQFLMEEKRVPVLPSALWQENSNSPCDTGTSLSIIADEFPGLDFTTVDPLYPDKTSNVSSSSNSSSNPYAFTRKAVVDRGQMCLKELYSRKEKVVAVVSHSAFLRTAISGRQFANADWRVFEFEERMGSEDEAFVLRESEETEKRGGGLGRSEIGVFKIREEEFPVEESEVLV